MRAVRTKWWECGSAPRRLAAHKLGPILVPVTAAAAAGGGHPAHLPVMRIAGAQRAHARSPDGAESRGVPLHLGPLLAFPLLTPAAGCHSMRCSEAAGGAI